jgi:hypothetical protein
MVAAWSILVRGEDGGFGALPTALGLTGAASFLMPSQWGLLLLSFYRQVNQAASWVMGGKQDLEPGSPCHQSVSFWGPANVTPGV